MVKKTVATFGVDYYQVLDKDGNADQSLMPRLSDEQLRQMYESMVFIRAFDQKAFTMQRQGRIGTYIQVAGQEASQVGAALAMQPQDMLFPSFRESGMLIARKHPIYRLLMYWNGDERGLYNEEEVQNFPIAIPVGTHIPHAVGAGWAARLQGKKQVAVGVFGDGATSKGDFHESLNFAQVFKANTVLFCQNNQWAISVPREQQTKSETIAQKAISYGVEGVQVDGNDIIAVYMIMKKALEKARNGGGPTFIEALTYRMGDHSTSDDAKKYRDEAEAQRMKELDPVVRMEKFLQKKGLWSQQYKDALLKKYQDHIEEQVGKFEQMPDPSPSDMFTTLYGKMPERLERQMKEMGFQ
ncbi:TPA: pyruvate dehydrogenase (acetyl-transferring) E1 component subunit alpha [Candidatus Woesearchaeota archaeon]|nr:pyruvate dehydrogenase (acetyl-transferring) E1 component subunit alpha [Candidatus Woesearchaeota archaeon]HIH91347.1 pyruvate dehydrogenase (acetyl-transferring) E1 component subunit alpha [Candidatus Woesearchaeota archaeon]HII64338.1 pyruvate dehydrogenase (acetyl-transferring) E1 component subunit alpha [Candidatus Woesearchaeota archaeon]HIJ19115.1 pyruvate dehydrogenase (acetyl-transferring) E1 component subunit alpha [Candidatus Woesearchaeota archaeon]